MMSLHYREVGGNHSIKSDLRSNAMYCVMNTTELVRVFCRFGLNIPWHGLRTRDMGSHQVP